MTTGLVKIILGKDVKKVNQSFLGFDGALHAFKSGFVSYRVHQKDPRTFFETKLDEKSNGDIRKYCEMARTEAIYDLQNVQRFRRRQFEIF